VSDYGTHGNGRGRRTSGVGSKWLVYAKHEGLVDAKGKELPVAKSDTLAGALHYARMYGQDGPTRVVEQPPRKRAALTQGGSHGTE
jgi:hypothetical protein